MAVVKPFSGIRYDASRVGNLAEVISPPYDVVDDDAEHALLERNPFNVIRVELSHHGAHGDVSDDDPRYAQAGQTLQTWLAEGVLHRENTPSFYAYAQTYRGPDGQERQRRGFFALVQLERPDQGGAVRPHESTIAGPKADRLKLISATRANVSPIFSLFDDPTGKAGDLLARVTNGEPTASFEDERGVTHALWVIDVPADCETLEQCLAGRHLYIADGHHRFATALTYREQRRAAAGADGEAPFDYVMMYLADVHDPGLAVFPIHRLVHLPEGQSLHALLAAKADWFASAPLAGAADASTLQGWLDAPGSGFVAYGPGAGEGPVTLQRGPALDALLTERGIAPELAALDITVLHEVIFRELGVSFDAGNLEFVHDLPEALRRVDAGEFDLAFLLRPTRVEDLLHVVEAGLTMPQKSTFFYPKPATGLVLRQID